MSQTRICACFYVDMQNLVKIGRSAAEFLRIFDFQNGGHPPCWIWYDVIADHPRPVFDGPNILLKLHVNPIILCKISRFFIFGPIGLKFANSRLFWGFWGYYPLNKFRYCRNPRTVLGRKHVVWAINRENLSTGSTWGKTQYAKSHKTVIFHLSGEKPPLNGMKWKFALV